MGAEDNKVIRPLGGRPPHYKTPEELQVKIDEYFEYIQGEKGDPIDAVVDGKVIQVVNWIREPEPATITGLCLFLGFESRQSFHDYGERDGFSYTIKKARLRIENEYEKNAQFAKTPTFHIFALKNLGWLDKQVIDQNVTGIEIPKPEWHFINAKKEKK